MSDDPSQHAATIDAPMTATVATVRVEPGDEIAEGTTVVVLEVMKMEHVVAVPFDARVVRVAVAPGDQVTAGAALVEVEATTLSASERRTAPPDTTGSATDRSDLAALAAARARLGDDARPDPVARIHRRGRRTARENVADLVDEGSFHEYGGFAYAAQERRRPRAELERATPADGLITGLGEIGGRPCAVAAYDYSVLAGTQGWRNHHKKDRLFQLAADLGVPVVLFAEGGGGRPGDTDVPVVSGLDTRAFELFARLSGQVPTVGIASGRCFAGNAALLGCCDVIIATPDATIGMAGPAMIEGGGLGTYQPADIGPIDVQVANGVVDIVAADDAEAVATAKRYLAFFGGPQTDWEAPDQNLLRTLVPENRKQIYDVRGVIDVLCDVGSPLELRRGFAPGMITTLGRLEGDPVGIVANDPAHLGGAIDTDAADKATHFFGLCDAHDIPVLLLCDTPGFMVGPEAEKTAQVRHFARMFVRAAAMGVPSGTVVLRKGYGLGAQAMAGGSFRAGAFTLSWPTGEFGGMGLEGAVRLGFRAELEAIEDPDERARTFDSMVALAYEHGRALNVAAHLEIDDVIDPAETRTRVIDTFRAHAAAERPARRFVDPW